ncbi:MAG: TrmH family RNA methyltransferase [Betaproteobacteria bacterium]|nr:RNA methyltransferase [Rhodocyclaceae bacterium]
MKRVTATANPLFRRVQNLMESAAARREARMAVLEGNHLLESCVAAWGAEAVDTLMLREDLPEALAQRMHGLAHGATLVCVATAAFERLSPVAGEGGVLSLVRIPDERPIRPGGLELWLDGIQDPGNAGGIVRTAAAAGAHAVVFGAGSADPWSAKCLRGAMGGHFFCAVVRDEDLSARARSYEGRLMAAVASGGKDLYGTDLSGPLAILLGAEGRGLSPSLASKASLAVQIPMAGGTESLNVGAAAAVLCFERLRQLRGRR